WLDDATWQVLLAYAACDGADARGSDPEAAQAGRERIISLRDTLLESEAVRSHQLAAVAHADAICARIASDLARLALVQTAAGHPDRAAVDLALAEQTADSIRPDEGIRFAMLTEIAVGHLALQQLDEAHRLVEHMFRLTAASWRGEMLIALAEALQRLDWEQKPIYRSRLAGEALRLAQVHGPYGRREMLNAARALVMIG